MVLREQMLINTLFPNVERSGCGLNGRINEKSINYQLMIVNGPLGYENGNANFNGKNGIRGGRKRS